MADMTKSSLRERFERLGRVARRPFFLRFTRDRPFAPLRKARKNEVGRGRNRFATPRRAGAQGQAGG